MIFPQSRAAKINLAINFSHRPVSICSPPKQPLCRALQDWRKISRSDRRFFPTPENLSIENLIYRNQRWWWRLNKWWSDPICAGWLGDEFFFLSFFHPGPWKETICITPRSSSPNTRTNRRDQTIFFRFIFLGGMGGRESDIQWPCDNGKRGDFRIVNNNQTSSHCFWFWFDNQCFIALSKIILKSRFSNSCVFFSSFFDAFINARALVAFIRSSFHSSTMLVSFLILLYLYWSDWRSFPYRFFLFKIFLAPFQRCARTLALN